MIGGVDPFYLKFWIKLTALERNRRFFIGRLKMREYGKCDTGKIAMMENSRVEKAGVDSRGGKCRSKSYGTPTRDYIEI